MRNTFRRLAVAATAAALAACSEGSPTAVRSEPPPSPGGTVLGAYNCTVTVASRQTRCVPARPAASVSSDILLGGTYTQLSSRNQAYNPGTGILTFEVAVTNKIPQPIGTTDGSSVASPGIRVFFVSGPTVTSGTGTMSVVPDGFATFTGAGQPYFEYDEILAYNAQSAYHTWTFVAPPTVVTYAFTVYVSAPVQFPNGWIEVSPPTVDTFTGYMEVLSATAYSALGNVLAGGTINWSVDDPSVATVSSSGLVYAVAPGTATVTALDGVRSGTSVITVQ